MVHLLYCPYLKNTPVTNCWPISLLYDLSKMLEQLIIVKIIGYVDVHKYISCLQLNFGFLKNRSIIQLPIQLKSISNTGNLWLWF